MPRARNVLGTELEVCCRSPLTGWYRTGSCETGSDDVGRHVVCVEITSEFLDFSRLRGNDLATPRPDLGFPGLRPGDRWCVCAARWKEAFDAGVAPPVRLLGTEASALEVVSLDALSAHALDLN